MTFFLQKTYHELSITLVWLLFIVFAGDGGGGAGRVEGEIITLVLNIQKPNVI